MRKNPRAGNIYPPGKKFYALGEKFYSTEWEKYPWGKMIYSAE